MFQTLDFIDVTREYCETTDVTRAVPNELKNCNIAYIELVKNKSKIRFKSIINKCMSWCFYSEQR